MIEPVVKTIDVPCSQEVAFNIFTKDFSVWWPKDKHSVSAMGGSPARSVSMDPRKGGALSEVDASGESHNWGSVSVFDPFAKLSLLWHIGKPVEQATLVDLTFEPTGNGTKVTLTHHGWEALGEDGAGMREGYNAGWVHVFETCFAGACEKTPA